jgi:hypothetical protein
LEQYELSCKERGLEITKLQLQKIRLEAVVNDFQDRNEKYLKVIKSVGEEVLSALPNVKMFLRYALLSITESIRNNPERYRSIFYNMSPSIIDYSGNSSSQDYTSSSSMYGPDQQQKSSPNYNTEDNISMIVEEAEKLYNKVIKDCTNKVGSLSGLFEEGIDRAHCHHLALHCPYVRPYG